MQADSDSNIYAKYNMQAIYMSIVILVCIISYILLTTEDYKKPKKLIQQAADWQWKTKGTVAISSSLMNPFKEVAGPIYINTNKINTLVVGSSTLMGIRREMFPKNMSSYNYSLNKFTFSKIIGATNYFINQNENIKWAIIGLDTFMGNFLIEKDNFYYEPSRQKKQKEISFKEKFFDAITLTRLVITIKNMWASIVFGNTEYQCPENDGWGKDFGVVLIPGRCSGIRHDGSATFNYHKMSKLEWKNSLNEKILKTYTTQFEKFDRKLSEGHLKHLKSINDNLMQRSGGLIIIFPPIIPGAEELILKSSAGNRLKNFKNKLSQWGDVNKIIFINAGKSENYECSPEEFYDTHHALDYCFSKIISSHFKIQ